MQVRRAELLLLAAIVAPLLLLRFSLHSGAGPYSVDGSYYFQIARNVAEGRGLTTNVDLYHQALPDLPARTNIYPAWPLLLGNTARLVGLENATHHLPRILYVIALVALYIAIRRIAGDVRVAGPLNVAHVIVALFGTTSVFFFATTYPYTEALAFSLCSAALWMLTSATPTRFLIAGVVAGLAVLTRSQMLLFAIGAGFALLALSIRDRNWKRLLAFAGGVVLTVGPWLYWVSTFARPFSLRLIFASYHGHPAVPEYPMARPATTIVDRIGQLFEGLRVAFDPTNVDSFVALYGVAALLVPIAAIHYAARLRRDPIRIDPGLLVLVTSGFFLSFVLVAQPQQFFRPWLFGWRHGLPLILLIAAAAIELIGHGARVVKWGAVALLTFSILTGTATVAKAIAAGPPPGPSPAERQFAAWLERNDPRAIVMSTNAQKLSVFTRAGLRWAECNESSSVTRNVVRHVRTNYIAVYDHERRCRFVQDLADVVEPVARFGESPGAIYLLRVNATPP